MLNQHLAQAKAFSRPSARIVFALPPGLLAFAVLIVLAGGFGPNTDLALEAALVLVVGGALLWRPGESPILLLVFVLQWLQASVAIYHANWLGTGVAAYSMVGGSTSLAVELSLSALLVLAIGLRLGAGAADPAGAAAARHIALAVPAGKWFQLYIQAYALAFVALASAWIVPGLAQPLLALASLKWASFFMLAYAAFVNPRGRWQYFVGVFLFELVQGIGGFFSDFKTVIFVTVLARAATSIRMSRGAIIGLILLGSMLLGLGVVWSAVKKDFRAAVSGGSSEQVVMLDMPTRLEKLTELLGQLDEQKLGAAADLFVRRLSYIEFFGVVLDVVPESVPYANGAIWMDAVARPFMPRLLFPEKSAIDDTSRTNYFTRGIAGNYTGTSISLGYIAESYIDFGKVGMMAPIFLFGLLCGRIYRRLQNSRNTKGILGMALGTVALLPAFWVESSITKTFGAVVLSTLVAWAFAKFVAPTWFPWLLARR